MRYWSNKETQRKRMIGKRKWKQKEEVKDGEYLEGVRLSK